MGDAPVNFANTSAPDQPRPRYRSHFGLLGLSLLCSVVVVGVAYVWAAGGSLKKITNRPFLQQLAHLVTSRDRELKGELEDRVNVLLLGMGGAGHEGAYLTDTIILASLQPSTNRLAMLSIPRDLAVEIPGYGSRKINAANALGRDQDYPGGGERLSANVVSAVVDLPVHYVARIDFRGFEKLVDDVGGIEINVERSFSDREYPAPNFRYQTVRFLAGDQKMDGSEALVYVRSRHGNNGEGSDFARARRQQKVLAALKGKLLSLSLLASPSRLASVLGRFGDHARTDLEVWEMLRLSRLVKSTQDDVITKVLDTTPEGLLANATGLDGAYLLVPRTGDFREVQALARNLFSFDAILNEQATIAVDGSRDRQLGDAVSANLAAYRANVVRLATNAGATGQTVVYDLSNGSKPASAKALGDAYELRAGHQLGLDFTLSDTTRDALARNAVDFLIVIGQRGTAATQRTAPDAS